MCANTDSLLLLHMADELMTLEAQQYITDEIEKLEAENKRLRDVLQDIADDPVISEPMGMKRGVSQILAIARKGLAN